jgi:hypothetical protein
MCAKWLDYGQIIGHPDCETQAIGEGHTAPDKFIPNSWGRSQLGGQPQPGFEIEHLERISFI